MTENLESLFERWAGGKPDSVFPLPLSGSYRKYFRMKYAGKFAVGVFNSDKKENTAFIEFTRHFVKNNLNVPRIYGEDLENNVYLLEDLGDLTLYDLILREKISPEMPEDIVEIYKTVLSELPRFQISAGKDLNYDVCYPRAAFDSQSMMWDLNYFKYYFLKAVKVTFDEQKLEDDFGRLINFLLEADTNFFLYRDFQSRNIMLRENIPYFIDYQGGRRGALQYDAASLLYDSKAGIPDDTKILFLEYYIDVLKSSGYTDEKKFRKYYYGYVLIRLIQMLGAYGFRGYFEKKDHFIKSIPYALVNLKNVLNEKIPGLKIPELHSALVGILDSETINNTGGNKSTDLKVRVNSFSFREAIPEDNSGNGGGFVFDCRPLPNPGRLEQYTNLTGLDKPVVDYLESMEEVSRFAASVFEIIDQAVLNYTERNFTDLMVNFGCTGGKHRSVYFAEKLSSHLKEKFNIDVETKHINLLKKGLIPS